jgi:hypothetical protein
MKTAGQRAVRERHLDAVEKKRQRILMYNALIDEWTLFEGYDEEYVKELRRKLHMAECQLKSMKDW